MYFRTLISLAFYAVFCLLSFVEGKEDAGFADEAELSRLEEMVVVQHSATSNTYCESPVSSGASASEVNNHRGSRMPVKRNHTGSFMIRSRVSINPLMRDLDQYPRRLLFPSGTLKAAHYLIGLGKLII